MFDMFGRHTPYILSSYMVAVGILLLLVGGSIWKARVARKMLEGLRSEE